MAFVRGRERQDGRIERKVIEQNENALTNIRTFKRKKSRASFNLPAIIAPRKERRSVCVGIDSLLRVRKTRRCSERAKKRTFARRPLLAFSIIVCPPPPPPLSSISFSSLSLCAVLTFRNDALYAAVALDRTHICHNIGHIRLLQNTSAYLTGTQYVFRVAKTQLDYYAIHSQSNCRHCRAQWRN